MTADTRSVAPGIPSLNQFGDEDEWQPAQKDSAGRMEERAKDDFETWKRNVPYLYDFCMSVVLDWPSLSVEYFTRTQRMSSDSDCYSHKLLLGTSTSGQERDYIIISEVKVPSDEMAEDVMQNESSDDFRNSPEYLTSLAQSYRVTAKLPHPGDVNRALHMPQNPFTIATKTTGGTVLIFDYSTHESFSSDMIKPQITLEGHDAEGYGLHWSSMTSGKLLSGSGDGSICTWDVSSQPTDGSLSPLYRVVNESAGSSHEMKSLERCSVNDVCWSPSDQFLFASADDSGSLKMWDSRDKSRISPCFNCEASEEPLLTLSINSFAAHYIATGGDDGKIQIVDARFPAAPVHSLTHHSKQITRINWDNTASGFLGSSGADRVVVLWNLNQSTSTPEDAQFSSDPAPASEVVFIHCGHTAGVTDFTFNPNEKGQRQLASISEDNVLQVWQPSETEYYDAL